MLITCHLLTGAVIASTPVNPFFSLPVSFLSHFVLDAFPHLEATTFSVKKEGEDYYPSQKEIFYVALDAIFGLLILLFIYLKLKNPFILLGAFLAILPDLIDNMPLWYKIRKIPGFKQFHQFHDKIHFGLKPKAWIWGIPLQLVLLGVIIWYFLGF
jgi:hypothetical protein